MLGIKSSRILPTEGLNDLGFGTEAARRTQGRLLNRDGSFNIFRHGGVGMRMANPYRALLELSWPKFLFLVICSYLLINILFAFLFLAAGLEQLAGSTARTSTEMALDAFFFSIQTFATIGYGRLNPEGSLLNFLVVVESVVQFLWIALHTGVVFSRFSRPVARIMYSERAVIAPYRGGTAFMFRIANGRRSELTNVSATVIYARRRESDLLNPGAPAARDFTELKLERSQVRFFPLNWTVVHPIDGESPLSGLDEASLRSGDAEFLILIEGLDDTFAQVVQSRCSYTAEEVVWGAKFSSILQTIDGGSVTVDLSKLSEFEKTDLQAQ